MFAMKEVTEMQLRFTAGDDNPLTYDIVDKVVADTNCFSGCGVSAEMQDNDLILTLTLRASTLKDNQKLLRDIRETAWERVAKTWPGSVIMRNYKATMVGYTHH